MCKTSELTAVDSYMHRILSDINVPAPQAGQLTHRQELTCKTLCQNVFFFYLNDTKLFHHIHPLQYKKNK